MCATVLSIISVNNTALKIGNHHKYVGIVFDDKLQWSPHIDKVCKSICHIIWLTSYFLDQVYIQVIDRVFGVVPNVLSLVLSQLYVCCNTKIVCELYCCVVVVVAMYVAMWL